MYALLSFHSQTAGLCTVEVPASGGTFVEGFVGAPQHLNPLLSDPFPVDRAVTSLIFDGLTRYDKEGVLVPALAQSWNVSDDGLSVRFKLRDDVMWHDGELFSAKDVVFTYRLLQDDAFPGSPAVKMLWQSVTIRQIDDLTVEFSLEEPYAPFLDATTRGILPAHLLNGVSAAEVADDPFNTTPVGTGPFVVESGQNWRQMGRLRLSPNPMYWRQGTQIAEIELRFYPDMETMIEAYRAGDLHALNEISPQDLPEADALPGIRLFTAAAPRYTALFFNLTDSGFSGLQARETRQALAYALDRGRLVDDVLNGQGLPLEGPYLPSSWAYEPGLLTPYASRPISATTLLKESGWVLPEGSRVRQQEDARFSIQLLALDEPVHAALARQIATQWAAVGVEVAPTLVSDFGEFRQALAERAFDVALVDITPPGDPDLYDFWSQEAIIRGQNYTGWNNRRASEALEAARQTWNMSERRPYYESFLRYFDNDLPALTLFQYTTTYALSDKVHQAEIGRITHPRDRFETFADWFLLYREVSVECSEDGTIEGG
ncbi:MAG: peptide ABC transporter substrate-binding protein [Anaerolineae bacterium]